MTYSVVSTNTGVSAGAGTTVSAASFTPTAGATLIAAVLIVDSGSTAGITCTLADTSGGNDTWTTLDADDTLLGAYFGYRWYVLTVALATATVVQATSSASVLYGRNIVVFEVTGLEPSAYLDAVYGSQAAPTTGADLTTTADTATLSQWPALVLAVSTNAAGSGAPNAGTGFTDLGAFWNASSARAEHKRVTTSAATSGKFTATVNVGHYTTAAVFKEQQGGGTTIGPVIGGAYRMGVWAQ